MPTMPMTPAAPSTGALIPLGVDQVTISQGFWGTRQEVNKATLTHIRRFLENEGWLANFDLAAAGTLPEGRRGREFADSEVYKYLEAAAWEVGRTADAARESDFQAVVARVAAAQEPDGYVHTHFGRPGQEPRWSDLEWGHELYCLGHLFQAAVARARTRPHATDGLLGVATRAADLVCEVFGPGGIESVCGHAEVETGLAELGRVTGRAEYTRQAALFVERRGHQVLRDIEWGRSYFQDDVPIRDAVALRGHAVRANYLASGAVDVAVDSGDEGLLDAMARQWDHTVARRTYVTGGQGSHHQDEAFGEDWVLPPDRAYSETCAGIASIQFSWRLLLARGEAKYADLIERTLFNVVATSPSEEGTSFYYANTLHQRTPGQEAPADAVSPRASSSLRAPWFEVSCCPPNVARTFASLAAYVATVSEAGVQIHQFARSRITAALPDGTPVDLEVETDYPRSGAVAVRFVSGVERDMTLSIRVPSWAVGATLAGPDGDARPVSPGMATVTAAFSAGDTVLLDLPVAPRVTVPDSRIDAVRGCVAVERGPEVYCLESVDVAAAGLADALADLTDLWLDPAVPLRDTAAGVEATIVAAGTEAMGWPYVPAVAPLGAQGAVVAQGALEAQDSQGSGRGGSPVSSVPEESSPRAPGEPLPGAVVPGVLAPGGAGESGQERTVPVRRGVVTLIPYHSWASRGPSTMRVWIPRFE